MTQPWGKLDRNYPVRSSAPRLSLVAHCVDVAAVVQALLKLPTWRRRFEVLAGRPLTGLDVDRLSVLAFLHDVGKAGSGFQSKGFADEVALLWRSRHRAHDGRQFGHVQAALPLIEAGDASFDSLRAALGSDKLFNWGDPDDGGQCVTDLWLAAVSHHGEPMTTGAAQQMASGPWPTWHQPIGDYCPADGLRELAEAVRALWPRAFAADDTAAPLQFPPAFVHAFAGLVSLADWIGSSTDEGFFPYDLDGSGSADMQGPGRWSASRARAAEVLRAIRIDIEDARADLSRRSPTFHDLWGANPRDLQSACAATDLGPMVVLEAETGSGKTEAALWRFKTLFEEGEVDALCFLLPTRVAATQIYGRLTKFLERLFPSPELRPSVLLAVPGYLRANGVEGRRDPALPGWNVLWPDDPDDPDGPFDAHRPRFWAAEHSKRYFAGALVAGTIDQFLLASLTAKHAHLRAATVLRSLVVVDEVHASDPYMTALTEIGLARHVAAGGHALLMSATLTGYARAQLLLCDLPPRKRAPMSPKLAVADAPYPAVSDRSGVQGCRSAGHCKRVSVHTRPWMAASDADAVGRAAAEAVAAGARVLVLRNTVRQAQATQRTIELMLGTDHPALLRTRLNRPPALHHGRYAFEDRRLLDSAVEAAFGKSAIDVPLPRVVVGTQTLEISLDCDADLLITDLAPIDVLLQRIGRLHRHTDRQAHRPEAFKAPQVVVLTPRERDLSGLMQGRPRGLGIGRQSAYENLLAVEAAWRLALPESGSPWRENGQQEAGVVWQVPEDNRRLVEAGADPTQLVRLADLLGGDWPRFASSMFGSESAQRGQARSLRVDWTKPWNEAEWSDLGEQARTRLGLDSIELALPEPWHSPVGGLIRKLSMPAWMLGRCEVPPVMQLNACTDLALTFEVNGRSFVYDRFGLQRSDHHV